MKEGYKVFRPVLKYNGCDILYTIEKTGIPTLSVPCDFRDYRPKRLLEQYYNKMGLRFDYDSVFDFTKTALDLPAKRDLRWFFGHGPELYPGWQSQGVFEKAFPSLIPLMFEEPQRCQTGFRRIFGINHSTNIHAIGVKGYAVPAEGQNREPSSRYERSQVQCRRIFKVCDDQVVRTHEQQFLTIFKCGGKIEQTPRKMLQDFSFEALEDRWLIPNS